MLRKIKMAFVFVVVFKMFSTYAMEQERQLRSGKMSYYSLSCIADYLPRKDICSLVSTCRYLNTIGQKIVFIGSGPRKEIIDFCSLMQEKRFSHNKIRLSLGKYSFDIEIPQAVIRRIIGLNLRRNGLRALPDLSKLSNLVELNLEWNKLSKGGEGAFNGLSSLSKLRNLNLGRNGLRVLPDVVSKLSNLEELDLRGNELSEGGEGALDGLSSVSKLRNLNLGYNDLRVLPGVISKLSKLRNLNLGNNGLRVLPDVISNLSNLEELDLRNNGLRVLPDVVSRLSSLECLNLFDNKLSEGREGALDRLGSVSKLRNLNLGYNGLRVLPDVVSRLSCLEKLNLRYNILRVLPDLSKLPNLGELDIFGNYIEGEEVELLRKALPQTKIIA